MISILEDFLSLLYPRICIACGKSLMKYEEMLCNYCEYHLPRTKFHDDMENPVIKRFWGKVPLHAATAYFYFNKGGKVQHLMHQLKYKGRKDIGIYLGKKFAYELKKSTLFSSVDLIIPVPMHPRKQKARGYNQSEMIAIGMAQIFNVEIDTTSLIKTTATESQTRKSRFKRWENVKEIFTLTNSEKLVGKHILIVDDVVTTGSTIEACAQHLIDLPDVKVSVATLAFA